MPFLFRVRNTEQIAFFFPRLHREGDHALCATRTWSLVMKSSVKLVLSILALATLLSISSAADGPVPPPYPCPPGQICD
jgi:hypothetical protein